MNLTTLATALLMLASAAIAWWLGGAVGAGVLAGCLLGAGIAGCSASYQRRLAASAPARVFSAFALAFLVKLFALVAFTAFFRYVDPAARLVDWRSFVLSFTIVAVALLLFSTPEAARALKERKAS